MKNTLRRTALSQTVSINSRITDDEIEWGILWRKAPMKIKS